MKKLAPGKPNEVNDIKAFLERMKGWSEGSLENNATYRDIRTLIRMNELLLAACEEMARFSNTDFLYNNEQLLTTRMRIADAALIQCEELVK